MQLKSSGNTPEQSDAFIMSVIGILKRQGMLSIVRSDVGRHHSIYLFTIPEMLHALNDL